MTAAVLPATSLLISSGIAKLSDVGQPVSPYQIDFVMLESYFQKVNRQLYDQKAALQVHVTEEIYRQELKQRQTLESKLDTCLSDINLLRDFIYTDGKTMMATSTQDKLQLLRGEIESLKLNFRRVELLNAESLELFSRMKNNEQRIVSCEAEIHSIHAHDISEQLRTDLMALRSTLEKKLKEVNDSLEAQQVRMEERFVEYDTALKDNVEAKLQEVEAKLSAISENVKDLMEDDDDVVFIRGNHVNTTEDADVDTEKDNIVGNDANLASSADSGDAEGAITFTQHDLGTMVEEEDDGDVHNTNRPRDSAENSGEGFDIVQL